MCTGAEIPAALAATAGTAAAGTAGTAAAATAGAAAAGGAGLAADAGLTALTAAPEMAAGMADTGTGLLSAGLESAPTFGSGGMGMTDAGGSMLAGAPDAANPFSIGLGNFQNSTMGQGLSKGMDALGNANKAQSAMNMFSPRPAAGGAAPARPPGMGQPPQNVSQGSMGRPMGGLLNPQQGGLDSAKLMMLKRMGLLGSM